MYYVLLDNKNYFTGSVSKENFENSIMVEELPNENNLLKLKCYKYENSNWVFDDIKYNNDIVSTYNVIKKSKIEDSKFYLERWLEANPLFSTIHNSEGEYYTITKEKQSQLNQTLSLAQLAMQTKSDFKILWNSTSGVCEEWTFEQLSQLAFDISEYVRPRISKQQKYEYDMLNAKSLEEIESLKYDYENV